MTIEENPLLIQRPIHNELALGFQGKVDWLSPRAADGFREYRDSSALRLSGVDSLPTRPLSEFWPARGPVWDAIGRTTRQEPVFVEAKAHIAELASPPTRSSGRSAIRIRSALEEARRFYAPKARADWSSLFYQYANQLAHHYFLRHVNRVPSHLVFVYFLNANDVRGPSTEHEWCGALALLHTVLGLRPDLRLDGVHEVFVDVRAIAAAP
jgi:hypothetical protein